MENLKKQDEMSNHHFDEVLIEANGFKENDLKQKSFENKFSDFAQLQMAKHGALTCRLAEYLSPKAHMQTLKQ